MPASHVWLSIATIRNRVSKPRQSRSDHSFIERPNLADVRGFSGLRYNTERFGRDLTEIVCPPYDVITPPEQDALRERHPYNVIRLELPKDGDGRSRYELAAETFRSWLAERAMVREAEPALYAYLTEFEVEGAPQRRRGVLGALRVEPWSAGEVRPHERTFAGPKQDRLELMRACGANFSPIWTLYRDPSGATDALWASLEGRAPDEEAIGDDRVRHRVWVVRDPQLIKGFQTALAEDSVYIADGHHRYETALTFRDERMGQGALGQDEAPRFVLTYLVEASDPGLVVRGTHRLVRPHEEFTRERLMGVLEPSFEVAEFTGTPSQMLLTLQEDESRPAFGVWAPGAGMQLIARLRDPIGVPEELSGGHSSAWRRLDLAVLHTLAIDRLYGLPTTELSDEGFLSYPRNLGEVESAIESGEAQVAFLVRNTPVEHILSVADAGDLMPEKSTFFVPKPVTGMVMASLEGAL
jgi:uncharacterized protein (DUF1015 family)